MRREEGTGPYSLRGSMRMKPISSTPYIGRYLGMMLLEATIVMWSMITG